MVSRRHPPTSSSLVALLLAAGTAHAQTAMPSSADTAAAPATRAGASDEITVTGWRLRRLDEPAPTASRLGLSVRETPATIDSISSSEMLTRGFRTVEEATDSLPGITSGGSPGDPSLFSMRGFTGEQVTILHNGLYLGPANMINRPGNTWNVAAIDVLQGPASVLYGQGAVGGAVNIVNKHPDPSGDHVDALLSYGRFNTVSTGGSVNKVLGDAWAARLDASYHRTDGYVRDTPSIHST